MLEVCGGFWYGERESFLHGFGFLESYSRHVQDMTFLPPASYDFVGFRGLLMGYRDPDQNTCSKYIFFRCAQARSLISHSNQRYQ